MARLKEPSPALVVEVDELGHGAGQVPVAGEDRLPIFLQEVPFRVKEHLVGETRLVREMNDNPLLRVLQGLGADPGHGGAEDLVGHDDVGFHVFQQWAS